MRYRYLDDFRRGISVFAIFSYGIAVLGTPQCPPPLEINADLLPVTSICREEVTRNACTHRVRGQLISYCNEGTGALRSLH